MAFLPNPDQQRAIDWLGGSLAISAGAGSGKTSVLSRRIVRAVAEGVDARGPLGLNEIVAVTYTRKAAGELAERVRRSLVEAGLKDESRRVDEAAISTIDGLCGRILRRYAFECGVDPRYRVASQVETSRVKEMALQEVEQDAYELDDEVAELFREYGPECLFRQIPDAYDRTLSMGASIDDITMAEAEVPLDAALFGLEDALQDLGRVLDESSNMNQTRVNNRVAVETAHADILAFRSMSEIGRAQRIIERVDPGAFVARCDKDKVQAVKMASRDVLIAAASEVSRPYAQAFIEVLRRYGRCFARLKREAGLLDYTDVIVSVADLLERRVDVAQELRNDFGLVMIDEFQDTNELRLAAIEPLCSNNLCIVGDERQSIYRFQFADVEVFRRMRRHIGSTLELNRNYRSVPQVLAFVNEVFGSSEFFGEGLERLDPERPDDSGVDALSDSARVEIIEVEPGESWESGARGAEAEATAARVAQMIRRGVSPGDIVILMASMKPVMEYVRALGRRGVDARAASGRGLDDSPAVDQLRSYMRVITLPTDDRSMLKVLAGPIVGLTPDGLVSLRSATTGSLYEAVNAVTKTNGAKSELSEVDRRTIERFAKAYEDLRERSRTSSVVALIDAICESTDFDLRLARLGEEGSLEWAQIIRLRRAAAQWDERMGGGAGGFLDHLAAMERVGDRGPQAPDVGEEGSVRIMSIHASKGLEFPVVFVSGLGTRLTHTSANSGPIALERIERIPVLAVQPPAAGGGLVDSDKTPVQRVRDAVADLDRAETLRLMYVAMTRAQEALVLVGADVRTKSGLSETKRLGVLLSALGDPDPGLNEFRSARFEMRRWVASELAAAVEEDCTDRICVSEEALGHLDQAERAWRDSRRACTPSGDEMLALRPRSVSYSSLQEYEDCPFSFYAKRILGMRRFSPRSVGGTRATDMGSAVHEVLEHSGAYDIDSLVRKAAARHGLGEEGARRLAVSVGAFRDSELWQRVRAAERRSHEAPIAVRLGETDLTGSIDLIAWEGDHALVVDYKTGRDRVLSRSDRRLRHYRAQAECYALAAFAAGAATVEAQFVFLEQDAETVAFVFEAADAAIIEKRLAGILHGMEVGDYPPLETYDEALCPMCPAYGSPCSVRKSRVRA